MEISKILSADVLDIIFEGRNKDYCAYQLRKTYNKRLMTALIVTASIILLSFGGYAMSTLLGLDDDKKTWWYRTCNWRR
ncbi:hypothetical protein [Paraflavitalea speifideaquila]|uniref:hypothetical protein n=1 Tax=Paraflavitalea speifideaquila TaxID=3076558 RepID=UPI0028F0DAA8|nr:hypothetical protein [Paraflavitalea speifideiaquila]